MKKIYIVLFHFIIFINYLPVYAEIEVLPDETWSLQSDILYNDEYASGKAHIYKSDKNSQLKQPVIFVEGLNVDKEMGWEELYQQLNQQNLIENLRLHCFDIVILDVDNSLDYIQKNAFLLVTLIEKISVEKYGSEKSVVIGVGSGGLIARYALVYMENKNIPHETSTFISLDSPHQGGNIPLGVQHWLAFFNSASNLAKAQIEMLNMPFSKQMLIYHYTETNLLTNVPNPHPLKKEFMDELDNLGNYPKNVRKIAISNGNAQGQGLSFQPGDQLLDFEVDLFIAKAMGNAWSLPNSMQEITIFHGLFQNVPDIPNNSEMIKIKGTQFFDNVPGSTQPTNKKIADGELPTGDITTENPYHCFVPTISALDIDTTDFFYNVEGDKDILNKTPFDKIYYSTQNEGHLTISSGCASWIMKEVCINAIDINDDCKIDLRDVLILLKKLSKI